jgi:hypothetical protein
MNSICVLKISKVNSSLQEQNHESAACRPINLLGFLKAENLRLQNMVAQLQRDTTALREALQSN